MATDSDFLFIVAQIAATFAGFSTLVVVVSQRLSGTRSRLVTIRLLLMLRLSIIAIMFCLVPFLFERAGSTGQVPWRLSSAFLAAAWLTHCGSTVHTFHRAGLLAQLSLLNRINLFAIQPAAIIALGLGVLGIWGRFIAVVYLGAILCMLSICGFLFFQQVAALSNDTPAA